MIAICDARARALFVGAALAVSAAACRTATPMPPTEPAAVAPPLTASATAGSADAGSAAPSGAPGGPPTAVPSHDVSFEGVTVRIPDALSNGAETATFEATPPGPDFTPGGVHIVLSGYPVVGRAEPAEFWVYHNPLSGDAPPDVKMMFMPIYKLIRDQKHEPGIIPTLPRLDSRRLFQARLQYVGVNGGAGRAARFLTMVGDEPRPVNNAELLYVVQGLFADKGVFWSFRAPVTVEDPSVTRDAQGRPAGFEPFSGYLATARDTLESLPADAFTPNLDLLDAAVKSVAVDWAPPSQEQLQRKLDEGAGIATPAETSAP